MNEKKVGVGITTFNRFDRFKACFESLIKNARDVDEIVIVDDCSTKDRDKYEKYFTGLEKLGKVVIYQFKENKGVGVAKNKILEHFYAKDYDYTFTLEDDILVLSEEVFKTYITASDKSGVQYINFAEHGKHNPTHTLAQVNGVVFKIYPNIVGAFSLHTKKLIDTVGWHDDRFKNAMEHVDYAYRACQLGLTTPFWKFCDVENNTTLLREQEGALEDSSIRPRPDWAKNLQNAYRLFKEKHGVELANVPGR